MLHHNETLFDLLKDGDKPTSIYGNILINDDKSQSNLNYMINEAKKRFSEMFLDKKQDITIKVLEQTINNMWNEGWNPENGNINLFTTDFGVLLTDLLLKKNNGKVIFRSETDLNNLSIWWGKNQIEVFPFHKIYKRLSLNDGENLEYFYNQISNFI